MALTRNIFFHYCFCYSIISSYSQSDTLKQGHQLTNAEYLVSTGKVFTLGFFSPFEEQTIGYFNPESAQNSYIGIWYTYDKSKTPVWIANQNKPISRKFGALKIDSNGDLKILEKGQTQLLLKSNQDASKRAAVLTDIGNFVLRKLNSDGSTGDKIFWQSFDYPTDTLLLGMRLGFNNKTGQSWSLSSWVSDRFPAPGPFTLGLDPKGTKQLMMWRRGKIQWRSGLWHNWNNGNFLNLKNYPYKFDYVSNDDEKYFTLSVENTWWHTSFPMYKIDWQGDILKFDSSISDRSRYSEKTLTPVVKCRSQTYHPGCVKPNLPECRSKSWFDRSRGYALSEGVKYESRNKILGMVDCGEKCLSNCSCVAYSPFYPNGTGCELWNNFTQILEDGHISHRELYTQRRRYEEEKKKQIFWWVWPIVATASFLLLLSLAWLGYHMKRTLAKIARCFRLLGYVVHRSLTAYLTKLYDRLHSTLERAGASQIEERMSLTELGSSAEHSKKFQRKRKLTIGKKSLGIQVFSFNFMVQATSNFSPSNRLGKGGYGIVYKGLLADNQEIAIKRLSRTSKQGRLEFMNEVKLVAKLQHTNLVKLIGCCVEQGEKMLVYEYMQNKSLDYFIFDSGRKLLLDWKKRFNIINGVSQGLLYLHKYSRLKIIHRDLKSGNILLDREMNPKISDFGMARLFQQNESGANTKRVVGTFGYMSPEYAMDGYVSVKSDVYSFGVLLLEIISGKKINDSYCSDRPLNLIGYAWELWTENRGSALIDQTSILEDHDQEEAMKCINIGLLCVQENPSDRPTMSTVVNMIPSEANQLPKPKKPAFIIDKGAEPLQFDLEQGSLNDASISDMEAR